MQLAAKTEWAILSTRLPLSVLGKVVHLSCVEENSYYSSYFHHTTSDVWLLLKPKTESGVVGPLNTADHEAVGPTSKAEL
jgi:hypothetical protein